MKVLVFAYWHRRCGAFLYVRGFRELGCDVTTAGPWRDDEPFGTHGREPAIRFQRCNPAIHPYSMLQIHAFRFADPDAVIVIDGGEGLQLCGIPQQIPWVHLSTEGSGMEWSKGLTPARFTPIMCNGADAGVRWLPNAFDEIDHAATESVIWAESIVANGEPLEKMPARAYDVVQFAAARASRTRVWDVLGSESDLCCQFGDVWGPLYGEAYRQGLATWVCSNQDFVTMRVFEAMAAGCIVFADRQPSMLSLFEEWLPENPSGQFIGYEPRRHDDGEGYPDPQWLADRVRWLRLHPVETAQIRENAYRRVVDRDSYKHRAATMLEAVGLQQP